MGALVRIAENVENQVERVQRQLKPRLQTKVQEARAEWLRLKSQRQESPLTSAELRARALFMKTDARARMMIYRFVGKVMVELEKIRRKTVPHA